MFVLVATGENYADVVPAAILLSDWYFFFFAVFTLVGLFFLGSLLIATFESQYQEEQVEFTILEKETLLHRLAPTFCLWTYSMEYAAAEKLKNNPPEKIAQELTIQKDAFKHLMQKFWQHDSQNQILIELCASRKRKKQFKKKLGNATIRQMELNETFDRIALEREVNKSPIRDATEEEKDRMREMMVDYAERVFDLLDVDNSDSLDFEEFVEIITYLKLMPEVHTNEVFRREMQIEAISNKIAVKKQSLTTPEVKLSQEKREKENFSIKQLDLRIELLKHDLQKARTVATDLFWNGIAERDIDGLVTVWTTLQCMFLAFYGTKMASSTVDFMAVLFTCGHILDIIVRCIQKKSLWLFLAGRGQGSLRLNRCWSFTCVVISAAGLVLYICTKLDNGFKYHVGDQGVKAFQLAMAVSIFRLMVTVESFSQLLYSISSGLEPVSVYAILLIMIMSLYSSAAYVLFRHMDNPEGHIYWASPFDSLTTMFQLLVGEGWNGVMDYTTQQTYKVVMYFFMSYTMITTILFSQLFLGIIIQLYTDMEKLRAVDKEALLYVTLGSLCPDKKADKPALDQLIWGLMSTGMDLDDYDNEEYVEKLPQIENLQKCWRLKKNQRLCQSIQHVTLSALC